MLVNAGLLPLIGFVAFPFANLTLNGASHGNLKVLIGNCFSFVPLSENAIVFLPDAYNLLTQFAYA